MERVGWAVSDRFIPLSPLKPMGYRPVRLAWHVSCLVDVEVKNVVDYEQICIEGVGQVSKGF